MVSAAASSSRVFSFCAGAPPAWPPHTAALAPGGWVNVRRPEDVAAHAAAGHVTLAPRGVSRAHSLPPWERAENPPLPWGSFALAFAVLAAGAALAFAHFRLAISFRGVGDLSLASLANSAASLRLRRR